MQLERKNKKILVICPHPEGHVPGQRLKYEQYFEHWRSNGFDVHVSSFMSADMQKIVYKKGHFFEKIAGTFRGYFRKTADLFKIRQYDIVYLFLWATPFGPPLMEWMICKLARRIVYDIDDLIFMKNISHENRFLGLLKGKGKPRFMMKHADHVLVSTEKLLAYTNQFSANVSLIPATIDVTKYEVKSVEQSGPVIIGWSGSHTTSKYLHLLDDVLKKLAAKHHIRIQVMGDNNFTLEGLDIELVEWSAEKEVENLLQFDIGLHPIPDEEWVYGKSGGKLVQYMAAGIPIVASAIGPNFKAIKDGYNGFLVGSDEEWLTRLEALITDEKLRKQMGNNSRKYAVEIYSVEANASKYLSALLY